MTATARPCGDKPAITRDGFPEVLHAEADIPLVKRHILLHGDG
jgi:hypothetical protein